MNVLFIPPEEILTAMDAIAATRDPLKLFGFDDTYQDLIHALTKGDRNQQIISQFGNLQEGMPDNPIIDASIDLYEEEVRLELES